MGEDSQPCGRLPENGYVEMAVEVFALLADPTRVRIVLALREIEELSVNHLAEIVDKPATAVSQHLAKMRMARMVTTRHHGNRVFYKLVDEHASRLVVDAIYQAEHTVSNHPRHHRPDHGASRATESAS